MATETRYVDRDISHVRIHSDRILDCVIGPESCGAAFSECGRYRWLLWRRFSDLPPEHGYMRRGLLAFIGLNPSTADERSEDPTVTRCMRRAIRLNYAGFVMLNAFAIRSTDPRGMLSHPEPIGCINDAVILNTAKCVGKIILCWGNHGAHQERSRELLHQIRKFPLYHLGLNKSGEPKHPLYLPNDAKLHELRTGWN